MTSADKELEEQLLEAGNKLLDPPSSVNELLPLLDQVESCLSRVEQSPTKSMQNALSPSLKALVADRLLRHADVDVKVAVASCISEITRITAPEAPYDDDQMKEVFQLIVSSFENLYDKSSPSYTKRASIVETVAKVRSCVVMLDLECDALIVEMFQHFFKAVREQHPESVFSSMEIIMTLVIEESEDISLDLFAPILASVKKDEGVLPLAKKLGERVLESCATKLKPYLVQAVTTLGISLDDYSKVLATICQETAGSLEQNDADENKSAKEPLEESTQVVKEDSGEALPPQEVNPVEDKSPKLVMSNGTAQTGEDNSLADSKSVKKQDGAEHSDQLKGINESGNEECNNFGTDKVDNTEQKPEEATEKKVRTSNSAKAEPTEGQIVAIEKEAEKLLNSKPQSKDIPSSPKNDHSVEAAGHSEENDKETDVHVSSPKAVEDESEVVASPPAESLPDENRSKKSGRAKKKDSSVKGGAETTEDDSKKVSEETSDTEAKPATRSAKKMVGGRSDRKKTAAVDLAKKGSQTASDPDVKKHSAKKVDESDKSGGGSSARQSEDKKKRTRGKSTSDTIVAKSAKDVDKEMTSPKSGTRSSKDEEHPEETTKANLKRKRTPGKENASDTKEPGEDLVGSRVQVWWPKDRTFYKGVIDSFDPAKKRHKVMYDDGDEEILKLEKERWELIEDEPGSDKEEGSDQPSPLASPNTPPKKKGKANADDSIQRAKVDSSSKSGGGAKSGKSKGAPAKSGGKSKDGSKGDSKSKISKTLGKPDEEVAKKSKDSTPKSGSSKSAEAATKTSIKSKNTDNASKKSKSKDDDVSSSKPSAKPSKQETPKIGKSKQETSGTAAASKGKTSKSGGKSNINGSGKAKSGSLKTKDSEKENSGDSTEGVEDVKGKSASSSKAQASEAKIGKKRRRG
ncbi:sister chromatid cohesion protein PDS5 homolog C-like [Prosopis cineraria]|uniref:sister chromatid cohesion protein PDS5 homolog C-like n=1 Tax=Prosopis cineraria TaxID=364024 RepID=UPI0024102DF8|nr:sister chromatid cohesion protein PDS5 homolog C-like [Prosopis cineraria]